MSDVQAAEASADTPAPSDIEATARGMGWRPKDEFKGDQSKWTDAETFVATRWEDLPKLRRTVKDMTAKMEAQANELKEVRGVLEDYRSFMTRAEQRAYERAKSELVAKRDVAVSSADTAAFNAAQAEIEALDKEAAKTVSAAKKEEAATAAEARPQGQQAAPQPDPAIAAWMEENPWFNSSKVLHRLAQGIDDDLKEQHPGMPLGDRLEMVTAEVKRRFPEKFTNPRRDNAGAVAEPGASPPSRSGNKRTYENLPPDAKKYCDKFVKTIPGFTREQYLKSYQWD